MRLTRVDVEGRSGVACQEVSQSSYLLVPARRGRRIIIMKNDQAALFVSRKALKSSYKLGMACANAHSQACDCSRICQIILENPILNA